MCVVLLDRRDDEKRRKKEKAVGDISEVEDTEVWRRELRRTH